MVLKNFKPEDTQKILNLYNKYAPLQGYIQLSLAQFNTLVINNKFFNEGFAFVLHEKEEVHGFVCGACDENLPLGFERGYFSCLVMSSKGEAENGFNLLMNALENAFKNEGRCFSDVLFFNPIRLPWVIPNTDNHTHNNAPGVYVQSPLYENMLSRGYIERARECAMYLKLNNFTLPEKLLQKQESIKSYGYKISFYDNKINDGLEQMLKTLGNGEWLSEITACAAEHKPFLVATYNEHVVGFAGPIYPQESGRGYFTGIGVVPEHEGNGLGTLLFYRLCEEEEKAGAKYMSLFTGENNPARNIYAKAGFEAVRLFGIMRKKLI